MSKPSYLVKTKYLDRQNRLCGITVNGRSRSMTLCNPCTIKGREESTVLLDTLTNLKYFCSMDGYVLRASAESRLEAMRERDEQWNDPKYRKEYEVLIVG